LGQYLTTQPAAGAVGYIGYAHSCWIDDSIADYEDGFWTGVATFSELGTAFSTSLNSVGYQRYSQLFMRTLYGDPEMPVWLAPPGSINFTIVNPNTGNPDITIVALDAQNQPIQGLNVTMIQGWVNSQTDPQTLFGTTTDDQGVAYIPLDQTHAATILVSSPRTAPVRYIPVVSQYIPPSNGNAFGTVAPQTPPWSAVSS